MDVKDTYPVIAGLAVGIAIILVFSSFASNAPPKVPRMPHISIVRIPPGSGLESNTIYLVPKVINVTIGVNNTVEWINDDNVVDTINSASNYVDPVGGNFSTFAQLPGQYILPGKTFNFTFTQPGVYDYYGIPHPFMQGTVIVSNPSVCDLGVICP